MTFQEKVLVKKNPAKPNQDWVETNKEPTPLDEEIAAGNVTIDVIETEGQREFRFNWISEDAYLAYHSRAEVINHKLKVAEAWRKEGYTFRDPDQVAKEIEEFQAMLDELNKGD